MQQRFDVGAVAPDGFQAMLGVHHYVDHCGVALRLLELVRLRVSQLNGCAFCLGMHAPLARRHGVSEQELKRAKAQVVAAQVYKLDSMFGQAMEIGQLETSGLAYQANTRMIEKLQAVTAEQVRALSQTLKATFAQVACYGTYVPLYGAYWGMAVCSDSLQPTAVSAAQIDERLAARGVTDLQYYNADIHGALFALPNYYRTLLAPAVGQPMRRVA